MNGQKVTIDLHRSSIELPGNNRFVINAEFTIEKQSQLKKLSVTAIPQIHENGNRISLEIVAIQGQGLILDFGSAPIDRLTVAG